LKYLFLWLEKPQKFKNENKLKRMGIDSKMNECLDSSQQSNCGSIDKKPRKESKSSFDSKKTYQQMEAIIDESFDYLKSCVNNSIRKVWALIITVFWGNIINKTF
jgi:hypothetical protein